MMISRPPDSLDPKVHHNNPITSILAKIEANMAGADDAVVLDHRGFVAETNATNIFLVTDADQVVRRPDRDQRDAGLLNPLQAGNEVSPARAPSDRPASPTSPLRAVPPRIRTPSGGRERSARSRPPGCGAWSVVPRA
jgi:hypothetical protein